MMTKKPKKTMMTSSPTRLAASRRRMEDAADMWWEIFSETYPLFLGHHLRDRENGALPRNDFLKNSSALATDAAEMALDAYEKRWPGI